MSNTWTTASGEVLKVSEMEESHVRNCINQVTRNLGAHMVLDLLLDGIKAHNAEIERIQAAKVVQPRGDIAQDMYDQMMREYYGDDEEEYPFLGL